jgi:hypothetical protein
VSAFLRFVALFVVLVGILVLVVLPLVVGPFLAQTLRDQGMRSQTLDVSVAMFDPFLVLGRSRSMHVSATDVDLSPATVGSLELTLGGVSFFDRTWETVNGQISDVAVRTTSETLRFGTLQVSGPARAATATARLTEVEGEALIRAAAERQGLRVDRVTFSGVGVRVTISGVEAAARLEVRGGALVLFPNTSGVGGVPLIQPAPADPWQLEEAWISDGGLNIRGVVDTAALASQVGAVGSRTLER